MLPDQLCVEVARLAPRAVTALQERYVPDLDDNCLRIKPQPFTPEAIDDLLWLQDEFSDELLDYYDRRAPGLLEARGARVLALLQGRRAAA